MTADFESLWERVEAIPHPGPAPKPQASTILPSRQARFYRRLLDGRQVTLALAWTAFILLPILSIAGGDPVSLWSIGGVGLLCLCCVLAIPTDTSAFQKRLQAAEAEWKSVEAEWEQCAGPRSFDTKKLQLLDLRNEWNSLPDQEEEKMEALRDVQWDTQRQQFLSGFPIHEADIFNIGDPRLKALQDAKVKTAADIPAEENLSRIQGIGPSIAKTLVDWRRTLQSGFQFDPAEPLLPVQVDGVKADIAAQARDLELQLRLGIADLEKTLARIKKVRSRGAEILSLEFDRYQKARNEVSLLS
ncbi:hypothetical protein [Microvirga sesbaniae]|uniref:hypothetical protein n=2 Tax=Microvirga TaxID=186650 RepID=UPI0021C7612F|nr:hypothetical protein [Microvirga sp. HBU67692]